ncbi:MAG TPA: hypothetical protein VL243_01460 [Vicinamibacterales bacterium]|nr:hypothetical protein [Vicinamibacterales bacterium]
MRRAAQSALLAVVAIMPAILAGVSCGPPSIPRITLPTGPGEPRADFASTYADATLSCRAVHSLTADLALSGSAGRQRLRGHVLAGFAPDALRLEGVAPFGAPVFILAAEAGRGTLLLPRDRRVVSSAAPDDILEALVGVKLPPDDLLAVLTGCVKAAATPVSARTFGVDWLAVDLGGGAAAYLRRQGTDWPIVAAVLGGLQIDYGARRGGLPQEVRIRTSDPGRTPRVDLQVRFQSVEVNPDIDRAAFSVVVPPGTPAITVQELSESYHR